MDGGDPLDLIEIDQDALQEAIDALHDRVMREHPSVPRSLQPGLPTTPVPPPQVDTK